MYRASGPMPSSAAGCCARVRVKVVGSGPNCVSASLATAACAVSLSGRDSRLSTSHLLLSPERGRAERSAETPCHQLPHLPLTLVQPTYMLYPWIAVSQRC